MSIADALAQTYKDTCDIYRYESVVVNGITRSSEVLKYSSVKCGLSKGALARISGENVAHISANPKVFFRPETDVLEGDKLIITQAGFSYAREYKAGECFLYTGSHLEVQVSRSDPA